MFWERTGRFVLQGDFFVRDDAVGFSYSLLPAAIIPAGLASGSSIGLANSLTYVQF